MVACTGLVQLAELAEHKAAEAPAQNTVPADTVPEDTAQVPGPLGTRMPEPGRSTGVVEEHQQVDTTEDNSGR